MEGDAGGWLWFAIDVAFVVILGAAIVWGIAMWRQRRGDTANRAAPELQDRRK